MKIRYLVRSVVVSLVVYLFVSGVVGWWVAMYGPSSYELQGPCYGDDFDRCRDAQRNLQEVSTYTCDGDGRRVCLVPLGLESSELLLDLARHYQRQYGLEVQIMLPIGIADYTVHRNREQPGVLPVPDFLKWLIPDLRMEENHDQLGGVLLREYMKAAFPDEADDPNVVLIGVTPLDLYYENEDWRWALGVRGFYDDPKAVISTFRMNPESSGRDADADLLLMRARKMTSKYIGLLYYGLNESSDPKSPVYNRVLGIPALDNLSEPLNFDSGFSQPPPASLP